MYKVSCIRCYKQNPTVLHVCVRVCARTSLWTTVGFVFHTKSSVFEHEWQPQRQWLWNEGGHLCGQWSTWKSVLQIPWPIQASIEEQHVRVKRCQWWKKCLDYLLQLIKVATLQHKPKCKSYNWKSDLNLQKFNPQNLYQLKDSWQVQTLWYILVMVLSIVFSSHVSVYSTDPCNS